MGKNYVYSPTHGLVFNPLRNWPRNAQCFCGQPKKFKKCCYLRLNWVIKPEDARKALKVMKDKGFI